MTTALALPAPHRHRRRLDRRARRLARLERRARRALVRFFTAAAAA